MAGLGFDDGTSLPLCGTLAASGASRLEQLAAERPQEAAAAGSLLCGDDFVFDAHACISCRDWL